MAGFEVDIEKGSLVLDLHEYATDTALIAFETKLQEAYRAGLKCVEVIHGAPYAITEEQAMAMERGSIKWALRGMLDVEEWAQFVERVEPENGSTLIYIKPNRNPEEVQWEPLPEAEYAGPRRWQSMRPYLPRYTVQQAAEDAEAIVAAIVKNTEHPAVKKIGDKYIITLSKVIPDADVAPQRTMGARRRRLKERIEDLMRQHTQFRKTGYGSQLAYERKLNIDV